jgi:hypothetical protein
MLSQTGFAPRFDGEVRVSGPTALGASAVVSHRMGNICDSVHFGNTTSAWSMLAAGGNVQAYAQIGVLRLWGQSSNWFFYEYRNAAGNDVQQQLFPVQNGTNRFWVQLVPPADGVPNWHLRMNIDATIEAYTPWDPFSAGGFNTAGSSPQWLGETHYRFTDIDGGTYSPTRFESVASQARGAQGQEIWNSEFGSTTTHINDDSRYGFAYTYSDAFNIWTVGT